MSDILIKGMKMSKDKPICIIIDPAGQARRYDLNNDKYADDELFEAVPVPPHGDLIDRNPFIEFIKTHWDSYDQWFVEQLEARPTIIEAEVEQSR